jgi:hypothetical protein
MKTKEIKLSEFELHQCQCESCQQVQFQSSSTLSQVCLIGAPLLRDHLSAIATKLNLKNKRVLKVQFEDTTRTTKKKLKEVMRYVTDDIFAEAY